MLEFGLSDKREDTMTLDEAIQQLKVWSKASDAECPVKVKKAMLLGIEALRCIKIARASNARLVDPPLVGETDE